MSQSGRRRDRVRRRLGIQFGGPQSATNNAAASSSTTAMDTELAPPQPSRSDPVLPSDSPARGVSPDFAAVPELPSDARGLWARALADLSERDKDVLKTNKAISELNIEELLDRVKQKREICVKHRWEFRFRGRVINLRDKAEKIISWLTKFKEVGDIAIQYDPRHAALPWAGIRFLLQIAIAERDHMGILLMGIERSTNIISRCRIYEILYLDGNQPEEMENATKPAFKSLEAALIRIYTAVLRFLAKACRAFSKSGPERARDGFLNPGMLESLVNEFQALDAEVMSAVGNCKELCNRNALKHLERLEDLERLKDLERLSNILETFEEPVHHIDTGVKALLKSVSILRRTKILQWISAIPYEDNHNTACMGYTSGTCEWLLQHNTYIKWKTSHTCSILWLHGIPGAGKTKLISAVVGSLRRDLENKSPGEALAYFYCDRNHPARQSHEQIIRSFVRQLSTPPGGDMIPSCIEKCYAEKESLGFASSNLTFQECCTLVYELLKGYTKVTLVLDALDECERSTRHHLMNEIDKLVQNSGRCIIKVLISSRPDEDIKYRFQVGPSVSISATDNCEDILKFVTDTINNSPPHWQDKVTRIPGLQEEITNTLQEKAGGMFQWAKLQMDQLLSLSCVPDIRDLLGKLPENLERTYDEIMDRINAQKGRAPEIARRAFLWVMCASRPLKPSTLVTAVCQDPAIQATNIVDIDINFVLEASHNLLLIDQSGDCRFSHLSVQEYLETRHYSNSQAHSVVGTVCLQMLCDPQNKEGFSNLESSIGSGSWNYETSEYEYCDSLDDESILWYTAVYWPDHVRQHAKGIGHGLQLLLKEFLGSPNKGSPAYVCWNHLYVHWNHLHANDSGVVLSDLQNCLSPSSVPAFAVVLLGLNEILGDWWVSGLDVNLQNDHMQSLLYIAAGKGNMSAVARLLDLGAKPDLQGGRWGTALRVASLLGQEAIVHLLLDRGANIGARGNRFNALQESAYWGKEAMVRILLDRGADINAQCGGRYGNALQAAAWRGHQGIVHLLLERGADINALGGHYGNVLQVSACVGNEATVRLLLDHGADIHAQGGEYGNALQASARFGKEATTRLLLERGADINAQGGGNGNALQASVCSGSKATVCLLLDRGADINAQGGAYGNALQASVCHGMKGIARILLDRGADINAQGGPHGNALNAAWHSGYIDTVILLLERGADFNSLYELACARSRQFPGLGFEHLVDTVFLPLQRGADFNGLDELARAQFRRFLDLSLKFRESE